MSHKFDRTGTDPYVQSVHQVEKNVFSGRRGLDAAAGDQTLNVLGNAITTALGDIAAAAFRVGVNRPDEMKGLAKAVSASAEAAFKSYRGEVDPEAALKAIENAPRRESLVEENQIKLAREIANTRQVENLLLISRRLPDLVDFAESLGLEIADEVMNEGTLVVGTSPTPTAHDLP